MTEGSDFLIVFSTLLYMKKIIYSAIVLLALINLIPVNVTGQMPCSKPEFRQFDFWVGEWEAFATNGNKSGDSKISIILDSCVILEEWTGTPNQGFTYTGKSFNSYNAASRQWQQTWTDNTGNTTEFLKGDGSDGKIIFVADKVVFYHPCFTLIITFFSKLPYFIISQFGEKSDDEGKTWVVEYDLEYRRKKR